MLTVIMRWSRASTAIGVAAFSASVVGAQNVGSGDLSALLARIGARVEQYYTRARTIVCVETVTIQPLAHDLTADGRARRLVYELRVEWEPPRAGGARDGKVGNPGNVVRTLLSIDGRPPGPEEEPGCLDPRAISQEPLAMLLPGRSGEYTFAWGGTSVTGGRPSTRLDYQPREALPPAIEWREDCVTVDPRGRSRGRVWVDAATDDVLRIDEYLAGPVDVPVRAEQVRRNAPMRMIIERADSSIEYRAVTFSDPDETWLLPASIESVTIIRDAGVPRLRTRQLFSDYRRFTTAGRLLN
jgi:hypothetical protein